jgi:riboflavin kinase / FMN adenylyltransferase
MAEKNILNGIVVKGNQLGRKIGFPTANLIPGKEEYLKLKKGVYAVKVKIDQDIFDGMANIGVRPTLDQHELTVEVHLFDFSDDIYGKTITIVFYDFIREEKKFSGLEELKSQLAKDRIIIRRLLSERMQPDPDTL